MQDVIKNFRKQLPLLLHDTVLNDLKGTPEYEHPDNDADTGDVIMWDKNCPPPKRSELLSDTSLPSRMAKPINKYELLSKLRKYILDVNDEESIK